MKHLLKLLGKCPKPAPTAKAQKQKDPKTHHLPTARDLLWDSLMATRATTGK